MKNKGFTLIELLAVILILGIIALIAIPTVSSVVEQSRRGAAERTVDNYIKSIEQLIVMSDLSNISLADGTYTLAELLEKGLDLKGEVPEYGEVVIKGSEVESFIFKAGDYVVTENGSIKGINHKVDSNETYLMEIYMDPTDLSKECTYENSYDNEGKEGCMIWYAFSEDDGNYKVILGHNTTAKVMWNSNNEKNAKEVLIQFDEDVKKWNKSLNPYLVSAREITDLFVSKPTWFYLDTKVNKPDESIDSRKESKYWWLFDRLTDCDKKGCDRGTKKYSYGYWTSTYQGRSDDDLYNRAWVMGWSSQFLAWKVNVDNIGIRPVIIISKELFS